MTFEKGKTIEAANFNHPNGQGIDKEKQVQHRGFLGQ